MVCSDRGKNDITYNYIDDKKGIQIYLYTIFFTFGHQYTNIFVLIDSEKGSMHVYRIVEGWSLEVPIHTKVFFSPFLIVLDCQIIPFI